MTQPVHPRIAVVGPGAIGTTIAAALHEQGRTPLIAGRTAHPELRLDTDDGSVVVPGPVRTDAEGVLQKADIVFLAVKATQSVAAGALLESISAPDAVVCVLQNGIEQVSMITPLVPGRDVVPVIVWFPAEHRMDGSVRLRGEPQLTLPRVPGAESISAVLAGTRCGVEISDDFQSLAWRKLLQNATAGLMVLTRRRAAMFTREDVAEMTLAYLREGLGVARADGADLDDGEPQRLLEKFQNMPADMGTSILADVEAGNPAEWDIRNGVLQRRGRALGIPTPVSDVLVPLLAAASDGPG